ncbi:MAG: ThaI family type II restriction endonuclease [Candidatus Saccharibacteria bacterium]
MSIYSEVFEDENLINLIRAKLPRLFHLVELENSRNGKLGMEVGTAREKVLIALLMYKFGVDNVDAEIPITEHEIDVIVKDEPLSIKTLKAKRASSVKLIWTVDYAKVKLFADTYNPKCDMLLAQVNWDGIGNLYLFSMQAQKDLLKKLGKDIYIKVPKQGTNPRGVELSQVAIEHLIADKSTKSISVNFVKEAIEYDPYKRWLDEWGES